MTKNARVTPTQEQVLALKAGTDQDGKTRTWDEVARATGYSHAYVTRIAYGLPKVRPIETVVIDPRLYEPQLAHLSDEQVAAWQANPTCLCGCGKPTLQEHSSSARVPRGAYRLFLRSHIHRLPDWKNYWAERNRSPERIAAIVEAKSARRLRAEDVLEVVWRWRSSERGRTIAQLGRLAQLSASHIHNLSRQRNVTYLTAAKIYAAVGEPMTKDMARVYKAWLRRKHLDGPKPIILD